VCQVSALRAPDGARMPNSYPQELSTGVNILWMTRRRYAQVIHIFVMYLTMPVRSILAGEPLRRIARRRSLVLLAGLLLFTNMPTAKAVSTARDINTYKLYAHIKLLDAKEYRCLELLWNRESRWNPRADNPRSTAYGIPQLLKLREMDPFKQIDRGLKYIEHRHSTPCKAWHFHKRTGHY
jgi:hypothetical protein